MALFGKRKPKPYQTVGRPQSPVSSGVSVRPAAPPPVFDDPDDALRWKLVHSLQTALAEMIDKNSQCFERAEKVEKAFGLANTEFVNGVRQQESSKAAMRKHGEYLERQLEALLGELREETLAAQNQWKDLVFLLPSSDNDVTKIVKWCISHGVDSEVMSSVVSNGMFINTDFGLTRESFWAENERVARVAAAMKDVGQ